MLPQWPWVVWATTLQFPSNDEAMADGVEQTVAEAAARAMAQMRLPIIGPVGGLLGDGWLAGAFNGLTPQHAADIKPLTRRCESSSSAMAVGFAFPSPERM